MCHVCMCACERVAFHDPHVRVHPDPDARLIGSQIGLIIGSRSYSLDLVKERFGESMAANVRELTPWLARGRLTLRTSPRFVRDGADAGSLGLIPSGAAAALESVPLAEVYREV